MPCFSSVILPLLKELEKSYDSDEIDLSLMKMFWNVVALKNILIRLQSVIADKIRRRGI